jgi:hypothetical protein
MMYSDQIPDTTIRRISGAPTGAVEAMTMPMLDVVGVGDPDGPSVRMICAAIPTPNAYLGAICRGADYVASQYLQAVFVLDLRG